ASGIKKGNKWKDIPVDICVAPPFLFISAVEKQIKNTQIQLGAQNASAHIEGAHTGEVSVAMLKDMRVSTVIVGHPERRAQGETDTYIGEKAVQVLKAGLTAIVCVGETTRDIQGDYFGVVEAQLRALFAVVPQ